MNEKYISDEPGSRKTEEEWEFMYQHMMTGLPKTRKLFPWFRFMAAAAILLVCGVAAILWFNKPQQQPQLAVHKSFKNDIAPGSTKAILTLADGSVVKLDDKGNKVILKNKNHFVTKIENGQLIYQSQNPVSEQVQPSEFNTLATPKGGQYTLLLADGSRVWLNAASSLKYPAVFNGAYRKVILTGEAYFEIAKNKACPFIVQTGDAEVKVLGTHFNIMAYPEENSSETTLLEGAVQFSRDNRQILLKPGQQVKYQPGIEGEKLLKADVESTMAWRNGVFVFDDTGIDQIMRNIKRWYNVEVVYKGPKPHLSFTGVIPRASNISRVLKILESAGDIGFSIDGNKITCSKK